MILHDFAGEDKAQLIGLCIELLGDRLLKLPVRPVRGKEKKKKGTRLEMARINPIGLTADAWRCAKRAARTPRMASREMLAVATVVAHLLPLSLHSPRSPRSASLSEFSR